MLNKFIAVLLIVSIVSQAHMLWQVERMRSGFEEQRVSFSLWRRDMQTFTTTWTSGGVSHTCTTTRLSGEGDEAFARRHADAVTAMQKIYPPS